ncbi:MAG TPA: hypothetical protein VFP24_07345 [Gaiellaceae bacterium]|nr:hypothetical protein [Gaiellaceae bacterium]
MESGSEIIAWIAGSAMGGRARSVTCFSATVTPSATAAAAEAASAVVGSRRRKASQQPPVTAKSGHLTHHADAITKTTVSGVQ